MDALIARIDRDKRHKNMTILAQHPLEHRFYGAWSMESFDLREPLEASAQRLSNLLDAAKVKAPDGKPDAEKVAANVAYKLLSVFITPPESHPHLSA